MERCFDYDIMEEIKKRWSPRAYDSSPITREDIYALLEAARYAPSCFNEQPWRFLIADEPETLAKMQSILAEMNQVWANKAAALILIAAKKNFTYNDKPNRWHMFDSGTAWGFLTLEAQRRGIITHAMGGFDRNAARTTFNISDDYEIITVVAVGRYGDPNSLPDSYKRRERPDTRKEIEELLL